MKEYTEKSKKQEIKAIMQNRTPVDFRKLKQMEKDGVLENYDLFRIGSDHFRDMFMYYLDGRYMLITRSKTQAKEVEEGMLLDRTFLLSRCLTNGVQSFLQTKGRRKFEKLNTEERIAVILRQSERLLATGKELEN